MKVDEGQTGYLEQKHTGRTIEKLRENPKNKKEIASLSQLQRDNCPKTEQFAALCTTQGFVFLLDGTLISSKT